MKTKKKVKVCKWVLTSTYESGFFYDSQCGRSLCNVKIDSFKYCPFCGGKIEVEKSCEDGNLHGVVLGGHAPQDKYTLYLDTSTGYERKMWLCKCGEINWSEKRDYCRHCHIKKPFIGRGNKDDYI